jgi:hypothetical protein
MADTKKPSLTVLGGPMAGTRFVLEEGAEDIAVGSDEGCAFRLQLPGVSPSHARIVVSGGVVSIREAGSDRGLHVNDNRVAQAGTILRNGDIVWLGTPGDADVVMLQCILPRVPSPAPVPAEPTADHENETLALEPDSFFGGETVIQTPPPAVEPVIHLEPELIAEEPGAPADPPVTFSLDEPTVMMAPPVAASFEDETHDATREPPAFVVDEASTVMIDAGEMTGQTPEATVLFSPAAEPTVMLAPPPVEPTVIAPPAPPKPVEPLRAAPPPVVARPAPRREPVAPARPRPQPAERLTLEPARSSSGSSGVLYAGIGLVAFLALGGGGYAVWRFVLNKPKPPVVETTPVPSTLAAATPPPVVQATPEPVVATPEPTPVLRATPSPVAATLATPGPKATPEPSPVPSPKKSVPTPAPTAAAPSAEAIRSQQVAGLMTQAEAAFSARQYDTAIEHFDEILKLDPQNAKAAGDRASAVSLRDAAKKRFVPGRTVVKTEKASGGIAGFDSGDVAVQKAPDFLGRIEFEMSPASGIKAGDPYTLKFFLVNEGKKGIRIQGVMVSTQVNGAAAGTPLTSSVKEVAPQQRAQLAEVSGSWKDGTTAWSTELLVTANKGDTLKNQISWR